MMTPVLRIMPVRTAVQIGISARSAKRYRARRSATPRKPNRDRMWAALVRHGREVLGTAATYRRLRGPESV